MLDTGKLNPTAILRLGVTFYSVEAALECVKDNKSTLAVAEALVGENNLYLTNRGAEKILDELNWPEALKAGQ